MSNLFMICGVHGKIEIENIRISKDGKKICKICTNNKNRKYYIVSSLQRQIKQKIIINEKKCTKCKEIKSINNFYKSNTSQDGHHIYCKICQKEYKKEYHSRPGVKAKLSKSFKKNFIKRIYDLSIEEYQLMLVSQNHVCKICKEPEKVIDRRSKMLKQLSIDHCHKTGKVRGLLCRSCNHGIGNFKDNIDLLICAAKYLYDNE